MSDHIFDLSFGHNDEELQQKTTRLKLKKDEIKRISLAWWPTKEDGNPDFDAAAPNFRAARRLFHEKVGYFFDKGPEYQKLSKDSQPGRINLATIVISWPLDDNGDIDKAKLVAGKFEMLYWVFSKKKYEEMARRHRKRSLGNHDLELVCKEEQYQNIDFDTFDDSMLRKIFESDKEGMIKFKEKIKTQLARMEANITNELGKDLSLAEIRAKLLGEEETSVSSASTTVSTENIDEVLNDFLDE
jgi:hypothetical protein